MVDCLSQPSFEQCSTNSVRYVSYTAHHENKRCPTCVLGTPALKLMRCSACSPLLTRDVGRSQKLYDLEAQYQKPLVAKNQAALENELKEFKRRDEQFKQYVLDNQ